MAKVAALGAVDRMTLAFDEDPVVRALTASSKVTAKLREVRDFLASFAASVEGALAAADDVKIAEAAQKAQVELKKRPWLSALAGTALGGDDLYDHLLGTLKRIESACALPTGGA